MTAAITRATARLNAALAAMQEAAVGAVSEDRVAKLALQEGRLIEQHRLGALLKIRIDALPPGSPCRRELQSVLWELSVIKDYQS
jgi:hypothetical protein